MEYIQNKELYCDLGIYPIIDLTKRSIRKILLKKELGKIKTYCVLNGKKKDLKTILKDDDIKKILEAKEIEINMKYYKYKYLLVTCRMKNDFDYIMDNFIYF